MATPGVRAYASSIGPTTRPVVTRRTPRRRGAARRAHEAGASLVGILVVVVLLGALAGGVVAALPSTSTVTPTLPGSSTTSPAGGRSATTTTAVGIATAAVRATCVADFTTLSAATQSYAVENLGAEPPVGTAWATSTAKGGPYLQSWPSSPEFTITWSGTTLSVRPWHHGHASVGTSGTTSPPTGCGAA